MFFDMGGDSTYAEVGSKDVLQQSTGHEKLRFTVVLTISGGGKKLKTDDHFQELKKHPQTQRRGTVA